MRNNIAAYQHPTIVRKIRRAVWLAKLAAHSLAKGIPASPDYRVHKKQHYVENRFGNNVMRIDYSVKHGMTAWGDNARNITDMINSVLYQSASKGI